MRLLADKKNLLIISLAGLTLSAFSMLVVDQSLSQFFANPDFEAFRLAAREITEIGRSEHWFALPIIILIIGFLYKSDLQMQKNLRNWSLHFLAGQLVSGAILHIIKFTVGRQRPHVSLQNEALVFSPFNFDPHWQSFPSGHAQTLFCAAVFISLLWPRKRSLIFLLATLLTLTRVVILQHFLGDVLGGATIGVVGSLLSLNLVTKWRPRPILLSK
jgi:membrane-associated phospholipid phosphatase